MKLIHSGKVLKDGDSIASCGIKPNDFLVVMVTKPKKPAAAPVAVAAAAPTELPTAAAPTPAADPVPAAAASDPAVPQEAVDSLISMGFPEAEVRHCLRAANGNPDIAVEFLTNGVPEGLQQTAAAAAATHTSSSGEPLQALRNHPQFNELRRLVQSNPAMLQQVLAQIGQQQPELLAEINANQALFLQMMNEPIAANSSTSASASSSSAAAAPSGAEAMMMMDGLGSPGQMAQMIQSMNPDEVSQMAQMMGISPEQLRQTAQMIGSMPPEQLNQFMLQAMGAAGGDEMMGNPGAGAVLRLTEEEMAAVDRLAEMGFDRADAAQAFIACDKNEALAANLLMDSMGDGGGFFGEDAGGDNNDAGNDDDDEMYD